MIFIVGGTRPNFIKISPVVRAFEKCGLKYYKLIHTGQHYDFNMSQVFFNELGIKEPDYNLNVGSSTHGDQTGKIMQRFEKICLEEHPDYVIVVGDVNSTMACALVCSKMIHTKTIHIESGLRSGDRSRPEEINKIVTDAVSDYLYCTTEESVTNLKKEGIDQNKIFLVGDTVIDALKYQLEKVNKIEDRFVLATIHRPHSTDNRHNLFNIIEGLKLISKEIDVVFPAHPRTVKKIEEFDLNIDGIEIIPPLAYSEFISLMVNSTCVITDSGGVQVETSYLGKPCLSIMDRTSHLYTLKEGSNNLIPEYNKHVIFVEYKKATSKQYRPYINELSDGNASERITRSIMRGFK